MTSLAAFKRFLPKHRRLRWKMSFSDAACASIIVACAWKGLFFSSECPCNKYICAKNYGCTCYRFPLNGLPTFSSRTKRHVRFRSMHCFVAGKNSHSDERDESKVNKKVEGTKAPAFHEDIGWERKWETKNCSHSSRYCVQFHVHMRVSRVVLKWLWSNNWITLDILN